MEYKQGVSQTTVVLLENDLEETALDVLYCQVNKCPFPLQRIVSSNLKTGNVVLKVL
jgi:hypothetical protein